jgi:hypothetical protein
MNYPMINSLLSTQNFASEKWNAFWQVLAQELSKKGLVQDITELFIDHPEFALYSFSKRERLIRMVVGSDLFDNLGK